MDGAFAWYTLADGAERALYERIRGAICSGRAAAPIGEAAPECVSRVIRAVLTDGPELFQADGKWRPVLQNGQRWALLHMTCTPAQTAQGLTQLAQIAAGFAPLKAQPVPERVCAVYDWLLAHVTYGLTVTDGQSSYDALIRRRAVCKGIAKAFQYLMRSLGVFCTLAEGTLDGEGRHIWNVVEVDGVFRHVDVCMGYARFAPLFGSEGNARRLCMVDDETLMKTHRLTGPEGLCCAAEDGRNDP